MTACAMALVDETPAFKTRVNGQAVTDLDAYRGTSPLFTITFQEDNMVGIEAGVAQAVADVYSFIIAPPPPGEFEIAWGEPFGSVVTVIVDAPQVLDAPPTT